MDTNYLHIEAWALAFEEVGERPPRSRNHHQVGKGSDKLIPELVEDGKAAERVSRRSIYTSIKERSNNGILLGRDIQARIAGNRLAPSP